MDQMKNAPRGISHTAPQRKKSSQFSQIMAVATDIFIKAREQLIKGNKSTRVGNGSGRSHLSFGEKESGKNIG